MPELKVDKEKCIGCGTCIALAGASFKFDENGKAEEILPPGDDVDTVKMASDSCPVQAIEIK
ncbi:MAG: 4Fe-4S ferredoxin iron-sulfur binding domain protein [Candidatus Magasanikbacteria bacterium GW2011_GWA2_37_8]|uniref:Ferredoxin n=1 Tax=Candidatus Magasanikbacteria bacterium GW2011_GWA2_37_8 TaxID=1619036 RepID=A0A0G0HMF3_9BACT|nr:MAG: 4Fe-4S ferredoxin iron-sulfur binding domain protein [Candidatus Magasanikbacteria bacterium GW2011_GWA2_37_8]